MSIKEEKLRELCQQGLSDKAIGEIYGMTGEGIAYKRKKYGISVNDKGSKTSKSKIYMFNRSLEELSSDYYSLTTEEFSKKYNLSKTVWLPHLRSLGIKDKHTYRIESYPALTQVQIQLIIGSLLGDGGIDESGRYYEFHSYKQEKYLRDKHRILQPYSCDISPERDNTGLSFCTVQHPCFEDIRQIFYKEGVSGKLIPIDYIKDNWNDSILAYWFFDDGYFDDAEGCFSISNKCPDYNQLVAIKDFLEEKYHWGFFCTPMTSIYRLSFSKKFNEHFGNILLKHATPDLYYKIPESLLTKEHVDLINVDGISSIRPKFYRIADALLQRKMENIVFEYYRERGFPYLALTDERLSYLFDNYKNISVDCINDTIQHNTSGLQLCEYFFPNMYSCKRKGFDKSPIEYWEEDAFLMNFVKNRLKYADRITDASMRTGIKLSKICVSNFKPAVIDFLCKKYAVNKNVLDYSCGFGSRMLGVMSLGLNYYGYEPSLKTYENLNRFGSFLSTRTGSKFFIKPEGSEHSVFKENFFGFAFSSPPYFDFEKYSEDPDQSIKRYQGYEEWMYKFWKRVMENCYKSLIPEGYFGVCLSPNIASGLIDYTFKFASEVGFYFEKDYRVLFRHVLGGGDKVELVLIFSKKGPDKTPKFIKDNKYDCSVTPSESVFREAREVNRRVSFSDIDYKNAEELFREYTADKGVSRESYVGLLGIPTHCIEYRYGGWNNFIKACGLVPQYEAETPAKIVSDYFQECLTQDKVLSFYEYGKIRGNNYTLKMKRLFNAGKKYSILKEKLFEIALNSEEHTEFLDKL